MCKSLTGWLPASRARVEKQRKEIMSHVDDLLHALAEKTNKAIDRVEAKFSTLESEIRKGRPTPAAVQAVRDSLHRLHDLVPETEEELEHVEEGGGEAEEEAEAEAEHEH